MTQPRRAYIIGVASVRLLRAIAGSQPRALFRGHTDARAIRHLLGCMSATLPYGSLPSWRSTQRFLHHAATLG